MTIEEIISSINELAALNEDIDSRKDNTDSSAESPINEKIIFDSKMNILMDKVYNYGCGQEPLTKVDASKMHNYAWQNMGEQEFVDILKSSQTNLWVPMILKYILVSKSMKIAIKSCPAWSGLSSMYMVILMS